MREKFNMVFDHEIEITFGDREDEVYKTSVDSINETSIIINTPFSQGKPLQLEAETVVNIVYVDQLAIYGFTSAIKTVFGKPDYKFSISIPPEVNRTQRRNHVRVDVNLQMTFFTGTEDSFNNEVYNTKTRDLSGGGLRFNFDVKLPLGTTLDILLDIPSLGASKGFEKVSAIGTVVRCLPIGSGPRDKFSIGIEFAVIEKKDREAIIRYLFEHQRQLRKKGLL